MADSFNQNSFEVQQAVNSALEAEKKKKKKKKLIIFAVIAVIIIVIIAAAGSGGSKKKVEISDSKSGTAAQSEELPDKIEPGMAITVDDLKITYVSCDTDFKDYKRYASVTRGCKVIRGEFTFENNSKNDISLDSFECYADNSKCENFYSVDDYSSPTLESIAPGRSFRAVVYFEVPEDAKDIELECESGLWSDDKITFIVK